MTFVSVKLSTEGMDEDTREMLNLTMSDMRRLVNEGSEVLMKAYKAELSKPGTGRVYRRDGRTHRAASPGEPPAPDRRYLRNSIGRDKLRQILRGWQRDVGIGLGQGVRWVNKAKREGVGDPRVYGPALDRGFIGGPKKNVRVLPRPWLRAPEERAFEEIGRRWAEVLNR